MEPVSHERRRLSDRRHGAAATAWLPMLPSGAARAVPPAGDAFGLRSTADTVLRHAGVAATVFALVMAAGIAYLLLAPPVYRADALLQVGPPGGEALLSTLVRESRSGEPKDRTQVSGEVEILRAREIVIPAILANDADLQVRAIRFGVLPGMPPQGIRVPQFRVPDKWRGKDFTLAVEGGKWVLTDEDERKVAAGDAGQATPFAIDGEAALIHVVADAALAARLELRREHPLTAHKDLLERMQVFEPSRDSGVVRISLEDHDAARAAGLLNAIAQNYLAQDLKRHTDAGTHALAVLERQLPEIQARVEQAEETLSRFQKTATAIPLNTEAEALLRHASELDRERVQLQIRRDQMEQRVAGNHPELATLLAQQATVERALQRINATVKRLPVQQRDYLRLQRDVHVNTELYTAMLSHAQQLRVAQAGRQPNARLIDAAAAPVKPARPKAAAVLSVTTGLALLLALSSTLLARALRPTVSDVHDIEGQVGLPTLAVVPYTAQQRRLMQNRVREAAEDSVRLHRLLARADPTDPAVESLRALQLALALRARAAPAKALLFTSPAAGAGKTFVACNLAALMAAAGQRVLLLEADLRGASVHRYVGLDRNAPGISDVLELGYGIDEVIQPDVLPNLDVIVHGTMLSNPSGLLLSSELEQVLTMLRDRYDHIVIDSAPLLPLGDALAVARLADVVMVVVRAEESSTHEAHEAMRRLHVAGLPVDGLILNAVRRARFGAGRPSAAAGRTEPAWRNSEADDSIIDLSSVSRY